MFTLLKHRILALGIPASFALLTPIASAAPGSGFGVTFSKQSKHTSFGLTFTTGGGFWNPAPQAQTFACAPATWVPAHYETCLEKVWVAGQQHKVWCGPAYEWRYDACGKLHKVMVSPGHWSVTSTAGHYESRRVQVFEPGHWQSTGHHAH
jgi:hypothetical protein